MYRKKLQEKIHKEENKLRESVEFENGMKKSNPWNNIMNFNKYYAKKIWNMYNLT